VVKKLTTAADKYGTTGRRLQCHLHHLPAHRALPLLDEEQSGERPAHPGAVHGDARGTGDELGIRGGELVKITSARSYYIAKAFVTKRIKPMMIDGKKVYQIGLPIHQGFRGIQEDAGKDARTLANRLSPTVVDPNAFTPEFKGFLVKVEKV
jgi:anaerobic selenocysteine-containing dehydrogenase